MAKIRKILLLFLFLGLQISLISQSQYGLPKIVNYFDINNPLKTDQIWDINQTKDGLLYFATGSYFIEFDGQNWERFVKDEGSQFFSFDIDTASRNFYIGAKNSILVSKLENNEYKTQNISIPEQITSTWRTFFLDGAAYFFVNKKEVVFLKDNKVEFVHRPPDFEIIRGFKVNNIIYAVSETGIATIKGCEIKKINTEQKDIFSDDIRTILQYSDSTLLVGTEKGGLYLFNFLTGVFFDFKTDVDEYLSNSSVYNGVKIDDSTFAITTLKGGLVIINKEGKMLNIINRQNGLLSNAVYCAYVDKRKDIWLGTGMGVSVVNWASSVRYFDKRNNVNDMINDVTIFNDKVIVATSEGIFGTEIEQKPYLILQPFEHQVIYAGSFLDAKISGANYLVVSEKKGITIYDKNLNFKSDLKLYNTTKVVKSPVVGNRFFVVNSNDLVAVRVSEDNKMDISVEKTFFELPAHIDNVVFDSRNNLWLCHNNDLFFVDFNEFESLDNSKYIINFYNKMNGLPDCKIYNLLDYKGEILVSTAEGLFFLKDNTVSAANYKFEKYQNGVFKDISEQVIISYVEIENYIFLQTNKSICKIDKRTNNLEVLFLGEVFDKSYTKITYFNNTLFVSSKDRIICVNLNIENKNSQLNEKLVLRKIKIGDTPIHTIYSSDNIVEINNNDYTIVEKIKLNFNIFINFTLPVYDNAEQIKYQFNIQDKNNNWVEIGSENKLLLNQLAPGKYTIRIKAVNFYGNESNIITVNYTIVPNIFLSKLAIVSYFILLLLLVFIVLTYRNKRIKKKNKILEEESDFRKNELHQQKEELVMQSKILRKQEVLLKKESERLELATAELKQLSLVAQKTDNSVLILDEKGKIEWWNRGFTDLFAYKIEKYKDIPFRSAYKKIRPDILKELKTYSKDKGIISYTGHEIFENGEEIWYQTTITPVYDASENLFKFVVIDINISDIKSADKEILNHKQQIKSMNEDFSQVVADLALTKEYLDSISQKEKVNLQYADFLNYVFIKQTLKFIDKINFFVLDKPLDRLSGDFIWSLEDANKTYIAVGDVTGHEVQGAIVGAVGISILKEIIVSNAKHNVAEILDLFDKQFYKILNSAENKNEDFLDIALISLDVENKKLEYSGAKIPLYIIRQEHQYVAYTYEADRIRIGSNSSKKFTYQFAKLQQNDRIYITTDGWINQFGKFGQKKYSRKKFKDFLLSIQEQSIEEQRTLFETELDNWRGNFEQIDDIFIFGAELNGIIE